eukprot:scaffold384_cov238-Pinguiococcus_pyrenoidosus.AAC.8
MKALSSDSPKGGWRCGGLKGYRAALRRRGTASSLFAPPFPRRAFPLPPKVGVDARRAPRFSRFHKGAEVTSPLRCGTTGSEEAAGLHRRRYARRYAADLLLRVL